ncbi:hypothetical protein J6590_093407 [Homalodisca vitripennis]|nr:hypothetical protein J6590_084997 [Homalodisca vitripennis]KAG8329155.1 hypothetical protein J6590_093407 [Homalodisca vitripennis]
MSTEGRWEEGKYGGWDGLTLREREREADTVRGREKEIQREREKESRTGVLDYKYSQHLPPCDNNYRAHLAARPKEVTWCDLQDGGVSRGGCNFNKLANFSVCPT